MEIYKWKCLLIPLLAAITLPTAINYNLEEALGTIAAAAPTLAKRLVDIGLSSSTRPYTAVDAIKTSLTFLQSGVIDIENKPRNQ